MLSSQVKFSADRQTDTSETICPRIKNVNAFSFDKPPFPKLQIFCPSKVTKFVGNNFKFDENDRKFCK